MLWLISYDIADDDRRRRVMEVLKDNGRHVQYSVFECELDQAEWEALREALEAALEPGEDSCRMYRLCEACVGETVVLGKGMPPGEPPFVVI